MRLTGLRGVGKTVLLGEFRMVAQDVDWAAAFLELQPGHNTDDGVSAALTAALKAVREEVSRVERLKSAVGGVARKAGTTASTGGAGRMTYEPGVNPTREDLSRALFEAVESVVSHGKDGLMLLLDEVQVIRDENRAAGPTTRCPLLISRRLVAPEGRIANWDGALRTAHAYRRYSFGLGPTPSGCSEARRSGRSAPTARKTLLSVR